MSRRATGRRRRISRASYRKAGVQPGLNQHSSPGTHAVFQVSGSAVRVVEKRQFIVVHLLEDAFEWHLGGHPVGAVRIDERHRLNQAALPLYSGLASVVQAEPRIDQNDLVSQGEVVVQAVDQVVAEEVQQVVRIEPLRVAFVQVDPLQQAAGCVEEALVRFGQAHLIVVLGAHENLAVYVEALHQQIVGILGDTQIVVVLAIGGCVVLVDRRPGHRYGQLGVLLDQILFQVLHQIGQFGAFRVVSADRLLEIQVQSVGLVLQKAVGDLLDPGRPEIAVAQLLGRVAACE